MNPYEPKGTLLGHDTKRVADARSVEALVDFSLSNLNWLKDDDAVDRTQSIRVQWAKAEAHVLDHSNIHAHQNRKGQSLEGDRKWAGSKCVQRK